MTEQQEKEQLAYHAALDQEIDERNIPYHVDKLLMDLLGVHDLDHTCNHCMMPVLMAVHKHIEDRIDALEEGEEDPTAAQLTP